MPKILVVATCPWFSAARLAAEFLRNGCEVDVACPRGHSLTCLRGLSRVYRFRALAPLKSIHAAIAASKPDIVIPCDDPATRYMHAVHERLVGSHAVAEREVIERSLGPASSYRTTTARSELIEVARALGIKAPPTAVVRTRDELLEWLQHNGFPAVLKTDKSYGGRGVVTIHSPESVDAAWKKVSAHSPLTALKHAVINRDANDVLPSLSRQPPQVNVQRFISGSDATAAVACWNGKVLAMVSAVVVCASAPHGPSSVVRIVDNPQMADAAKKIARDLMLSGLFGLDFVVEARTDDAYLLEMNPRATQTAHLALGKGHNLPAALCAAVLNAPFDEGNAQPPAKTIALFPQEWLRDPSSPFLHTAYHDVPWDQPDLVRECLREDTNYLLWTAIHSMIGKVLPPRRRAASRLVQPLPPR